MQFAYKPFKYLYCQMSKIIISEDNCAPDLKRQMCKLYANVNMFMRKFLKRSPDVQCFLFKSYYSHLYCFNLWYDCFTL